MSPLIHALIGGHDTKKALLTTVANEAISLFENVTESLETTTINTATSAPQSESTLRRANFIWPEDPDDEIPVKYYTFSSHSNNTDFLIKRVFSYLQFSTLL